MIGVNGADVEAQQRSRVKPWALTVPRHAQGRSSSRSSRRPYRDLELEPEVEPCPVPPKNIQRERGGERERATDI